MAASARPGERTTSFAMACSLLSRYIRQNGAAPSELGLGIKGETQLQRAPATTSLLPGVDGEKAERKKETMELFPQSACFGVQDAATPGAATRYVPVGRSFSRSIEVPRSLSLGIEGWKGFYQSMRPTQGGLSMNIDNSSTAFIQPLQLIDFVVEILERKITQNMTDFERVKIKKALTGLRIEVTH